MMLSLQNSINSRNGPGGNKNRSVWLRVGVTGVAFQAVNVMDAMVGEKKISPGGTVELDASNPPKGDSAWFNISPDDIDSMEIFYLTYRYRFAPEEEEE